MGGAELRFILPSRAVIHTVAHLSFHDADSSRASELAILAFGLFLFGDRHRFAVLAFILSIGTVPSSIAQLDEGDTCAI